MTRKQAVVIERQLRAVGVYKPYVSTTDDVLYFESYPLTAVIKNGFDTEMGPLHTVKITDCSLSRIGADPVLTTCRVFLGQDLVGVVGHLLMDFHEKAYARASAQDRDAAA